MRPWPALCLMLGLTVAGCAGFNGRPMEQPDPGPAHSSFLLPRYGVPEGRQKSAGILDAESAFRRAYRARGLSDQQAAAEQVALGWRAVETGRDDEAMRRFNLAWLADPDASEPYRGFANIAHGRRRPADEVLDLFERARSKHDATVDVTIDEARYLWLQGRRPEALLLLNQVIVMDPKSRNVARDLEMLSIETGDQQAECEWGKLALRNSGAPVPSRDFSTSNCE